VRLVKGARSVESEWKSRSRRRRSRRSRRGLETRRPALGGVGPLILGDPRNRGAAAMQMQARLCLPRRASRSCTTAQLTLTANLSKGRYEMERE
jgi:hypothetical protein